MELYYIRHGETAWSLSGQHTGRSDIPLTELGEAEARALGAVLAGVKFDLVFTSPRIRARRTAELVGLAPASANFDLVEWDYGDYEGKTLAQIREARPDWDVYLHGCPGGESPAQVTQRADRIIARLAASTGRVAVVSHGHFGRVFAARWIQLAIDEARHFAIDTASYAVLDQDPGHDQRRRIVRWNVVPAGRP